MRNTNDVPHDNHSFTLRGTASEFHLLITKSHINVDESALFTLINALTFKQYVDLALKLFLPFTT